LFFSTIVVSILSHQVLHFRGVEIVSDPKRKIPDKKWLHLPKLPDEVFAAWQKPKGALNPSSVVATIDEDGSPRTAPFGSMRAVNSHILRFLVHQRHDTLANLKRDSRVMVAMICPPNLAVSVRGVARIVEESFSADERYALVEIDINEVKNDMPVRIEIDAGINISPNGPFVEWWKAIWKSLE